ncbi:MAG: hypothetical protein IJS97_05350 [Prevotella sp.]|nr:hypothetical protein [Prevotella sp.]
MKKEDLKAAIKANFENNEFATAMELNKELFKEYENVAGKRSLTSLVGHYRKKAGATETIEEESNLAPVEETITSEEVGSVEDVLGITATEEKKEEKVEEPEYQFDCNEELDAIIDTEEIKELLENGNKALNRYCIVKEFFAQVSDTEQKISTTMFVKPDGLGWKSFTEVCQRLGGKKGTTERKAGSFWKSKCGLPVGEEITKKTIWKVGDALREFAFRQNASAITNVSCLV